jgi:hypothetical protein
VENALGKGPIGRPRRWEESIKMSLRETDQVGGRWLEMTECRVKWQVFGNGKVVRLG